ncbi:hypothetical protein J7369_11220 [Xanthomonas phaseoli pv. dieffenbachiae]|nr:hypothetical protein [Xanthomonas phaseoli]MBO9898267.1 hypothetical protein [Xanthomonas phaseoli pv. dieffenbachiae]
MEHLLNFKPVFLWLTILVALILLARLALSGYFFLRGAHLARWLNQHPYIWEKVEAAKAKALTGADAKTALSGLSPLEQRYFLEFLHISNKSSLQWRHIMSSLVLIGIAYTIYFFV